MELLSLGTVAELRLYLWVDPNKVGFYLNKLIPGMKELMYMERLITPGLYLLGFKRMRGDLMKTIEY